MLLTKTIQPGYFSEQQRLKHENHTARLFFWATTVETRRASSIELARLRTRPPVAFLCIGIPAGIGRDASAVFSQSPKNVWYLLSWVVLASHRSSVLFRYSYFGCTVWFCRRRSPGEQLFLRREHQHWAWRLRMVCSAWDTLGYHPTALRTVSSCMSSKLHTPNCGFFPSKKYLCNSRLSPNIIPYPNAYYL